MKIAIAAGGTGGHIIPAISIASELIKNGVEILWIGNHDSMEEKLTAQAEIPFEGIDVQKLYRKFTFAHLRFPFKLWKSYRRSIALLLAHHVDAFIGAGGFVSGPVGMAAAKLKIPIFWQEQNSFPGLTTRRLAPKAVRIYCGYQGAEKYLPKDKIVVCGNPVSPSLLANNEPIAYNMYNLTPTTPKILLTGGSQGSAALNKAFAAVVPTLLEEGYEIIWQTGKYSFEALQECFGGKKGVYLFDFSNEMPSIFNSIEFAITRAGAMTLAELEAKAIPAILVPLPSAAGNHQYFNAREKEQKKQAILLSQDHLSPDTLLSAIRTMHRHITDYKASFTGKSNIAVAKFIADDIIDLLKNNTTR